MMESLNMYLPRHRCCALALMIITGSTTPALALPLIEVFESSSWSGGYTSLLRISNPNDDPPIDGWEIAWTSGPNIDNLWNGVLSTNDGTTTVVNEAWNGTIDSGAFCELGFTVVGDWPPVFSNVTLNGVDVECSVQDGGDNSGGGDDPGGGDSGSELGFEGLANAYSTVVDQGTHRLTVLGGSGGSLTASTNAADVIAVSMEGNEVVIETLRPGYASLRVTDEAASESALLGVAVRNPDGTMPGLPPYLSVGSVSEDAVSHLEFFRQYGNGDLNRRVDVRYIYLNGGPFTGWRTWSNEPGDRVRNYIRNSRQLGMIPCFVWYNVPDGGESYWTNSEHLFDADYMSAYWKDLDLMLDIAREETADEWPGLVLTAKLALSRREGCFRLPSEEIDRQACFPDRTLAGLISAVWCRRHGRCGR